MEGKIIELRSKYLEKEFQRFGGTEVCQKQFPDRVRKLHLCDLCCLEVYSVFLSVCLQNYLYESIQCKDKMLFKYLNSYV